MFIFIADAAFALELIALVAGSYLLIKSYEQIPAKRFVKFVSFFVIILSFLGMLCTTIYVIRDWMYGCGNAMSQRGSYSCPMQMRDGDEGMMGTQPNQHMNDMMKQEK